MKYKHIIQILNKKNPRKEKYSKHTQSENKSGCGKEERPVEKKKKNLIVLG